MNIMNLIPTTLSFCNSFPILASPSHTTTTSKIRTRNPPATMKFISFSSATILASLTGLLSTLPGGDAHGHEVRSCINTAGDLRIFIEHWHNEATSVATAGTMDITDESTGVTSTLTPSGVVVDVDISAGGILPGCASTTLHAECTDVYIYSEHDWVYYDFPYSCGVTNATYTLERGNTVVLMEACETLYPATIAPYEDCPTIIPSLSPAPTPCSDDSSFSFEVGTGAMKKCGWLAQKTARQTRHCGKRDVQGGCPLTCCNCGTCPTFSPTPAPVSTPSKGGKGKGAYTPSPSKGGKGKGAYTPSPSKGGKGKRVLRGH